jgi:hypothetical protein
MDVSGDGRNGPWTNGETSASRAKVRRSFHADNFHGSNLQ